jgi:hypothetical protein
MSLRGWMEVKKRTKGPSSPPGPPSRPRKASFSPGAYIFPRREQEPIWRKVVIRLPPKSPLAERCPRARQGECEDQDTKRKTESFCRDNPELTKPPPLVDRLV